MLVEVRKRILTFPEVAQALSEHGRPEDGTDNENLEHERDLRAPAAAREMAQRATTRTA